MAKLLANTCSLGANKCINVVTETIKAPRLTCCSKASVFKRSEIISGNGEKTS